MCYEIVFGLVKLNSGNFLPHDAMQSAAMPQ